MVRSPSGGWCTHRWPMNGGSCSVRHAVSRWRNAVHPHSPWCRSFCPRPAVPVACVTRASTTRPFRFSISRCPRQASFATVPRLFPRSRQTSGTAGCSRSVSSTGIRCERCGTPSAIGHAGASPAGWSHGHGFGVDGIEVCIGFAQCRIDHGPYRAQWRVLRHP